MSIRSLNEIDLKQISERAPEKGMGDKIEARLTVALKIKDYVFRLGYSLADAKAFTVHLLTAGKVRLAFPDYIERLELVNKSDILSASEAETAVKAHFESIAHERIEASAIAETQKMPIKPPV
ncbi:MAG: hypothetical protein WCO60_17145 [Verrucomicrobiota bacterium]